jgi:HPt (histidine-containing phosphotransfer) domain-containing protein
MTDGESPLSEAMNRLWAKYLPQMEERVRTLQETAARLSKGDPLSETERNQAGADAHKLAGVLGTFGLQGGTELAREAEQLCGSALVPDSAGAERLATIAERLGAVVASRE